MEKVIREFLREYWELAQESMKVMTNEDMAEVVLRASVVADKIVDEFNQANGYAKHLQEAVN